MTPVPHLMLTRAETHGAGLVPSPVSALYFIEPSPGGGRRARANMVKQDEEPWSRDQVSLPAHLSWHHSRFILPSQRFHTPVVQLSWKCDFLVLPANKTNYQRQRKCNFGGQVVIIVANILCKIVHCITVCWGGHIVKHCGAREVADTHQLCDSTIISEKGRVSGEFIA